MPDSISIDWQSDRLYCVEGVATGAGASIRSCSPIDWPDEFDPAASPERAGKWLAEQFARRGVRARHVLVSLPRQDVMLRSLSVPDVADDQLPDLVRLQAETIAAASLDQQILDFLPLPRLSGATTRQILLVTLARQKLDQISQVVESAGLVLDQVGISCIGTAELVARSEHHGDAGADGRTLIIAKHEGRMEISIVRDHQLLFMHAPQLTSEAGQSDGRAAWAEIRRALGSASRTDANAAVTHAWLIGFGPDASLAQLLEDQLSCEISRIDLKIAECLDYSCATEAIDEGFYAGALGLLLASEEPVVESIDFLRPRRTLEPVDHGRRRIIAVAGCVLVALLFTYGMTQWRVAGLSAAIDTKQAEITRMSEAVKAGQPLLKAANSLAAWETGVVDWLQFMSNMNQILPGTDRIYLRDCQFKTLAVASQAQVQATGYAKTRGDVEQLYQRLAQQKVQVRPHEISRTDDDQDYPFTFRLDVIAPQTMPPLPAR